MTTRPSRSTCWNWRSSSPRPWNAARSPEWGQPFWSSGPGPPSAGRPSALPSVSTCCDAPGPGDGPSPQFGFPHRTVRTVPGLREHPPWTDGTVMTTNPAPEATTPGFAGTRLALVRQAWGAVSVSRLLGLQAVERLGAAAGPTIMDRSAARCASSSRPAPPGPGPSPRPRPCAKPPTSSSHPTTNRHHPARSDCCPTGHSPVPAPCSRYSSQSRTTHRDTARRTPRSGTADYPPPTRSATTWFWSRVPVLAHIPCSCY